MHESLSFARFRFDVDDADGDKEDEDDVNMDEEGKRREEVAAVGVDDIDAAVVSAKAILLLAAEDG